MRSIFCAVFSAQGALAVRRHSAVDTGAAAAYRLAER